MMIICIKINLFTPELQISRRRDFPESMYIKMSYDHYIILRYHSLKKKSTNTGFILIEV